MNSALYTMWSEIKGSTNTCKWKAEKQIHEKSPVKQSPKDQGLDTNRVLHLSGRVSGCIRPARVILLIMPFPYLWVPTLEIQPSIYVKKNCHQSHLILGDVEISGSQTQLHWTNCYIYKRTASFDWNAGIFLCWLATMFLKYCDCFHKNNWITINLIKYTGSIGHLFFLYYAWLHFMKETK